MNIFCNLIHIRLTIIIFKTNFDYKYIFFIVYIILLCRAIFNVCVISILIYLFS